MSEDRPPISRPIKRAVRQRCGFGCVICGRPLYQYDHVAPYSEVLEHEAENIVCLCNDHHGEKTDGLLPADAVIAANQNPHNLQAGESPPQLLHYYGFDCEAVVGSNICRFSWPVLPFVPLIVDDTPIILFRIEDGQLLLTVQLFDAQNNLLLQVLDNELVYSVDPWDVEFVGKTLTVRNAPRDIFVGITFEPPSRVVIDRGHVWRNGAELAIAPHEFRLVPNVKMRGNEAAGFPIVIGVGRTPRGMAAVVLVDSSRRQFGSAADEGRVLKMHGLETGYDPPILTLGGEPIDETQ
jgi:hypothetical protein